MDPHADLGEFLRARRAGRHPAQAGLAWDATPRRVAGLRRTELARLAGVSVDYYTRLEQGRDLNPSDEVLGAIATALGLDQLERTHLTHLARRRPRVLRPRRPEPQRVRAGVREMLASLSAAGSPALVVGRRTDVLAANRLARTLLADFTRLPARERNMARWVFLSDDARARYVDWPEVAREKAGNLRLEAGRCPEDAGLLELIGELSVRSEHFRRYWAGHHVHERSHGTKRLHHPAVGRLTVRYESMLLPADHCQSVVVYGGADPSSVAALDLLATHASRP